MYSISSNICKSWNIRCLSVGPIFHSVCCQYMYLHVCMRFIIIWNMTTRKLHTCSVCILRERYRRSEWWDQTKTGGRLSECSHGAESHLGFCPNVRKLFRFIALLNYKSFEMPEVLFGMQFGPLKTNQRLMRFSVWNLNGQMIKCERTILNKVLFLPPVFKNI